MKLRSFSTSHNKKRKRTSTKSRANELPSTTGSAQDTHKKCVLLQLPRELRVMILRHLLYSPEPLFDIGKRFRFNPAILRVCRQIFDEGYEILYHHNTAAATIEGFERPLVVDPSGYKAPVLLDDEKFAQRFTKWSITVVLLKRFQKNNLDGLRDYILWFTEYILSVIPNLNELKGRIKLVDYGKVKEVDLDGNVVFANHLDLDDIAEQLFRPFSAVRVKNAEFVGQKGQPIRTTLSLSRLMMSDYPPYVTLYNLYLDLIVFLNNSLSEESHRVVTARLSLLELASKECDIDVFRFALRLILDYLIQYRGLTPPQHLVEFAQDSATTATGMRWITDCPEKG